MPGCYSDGKRDEGLFDACFGGIDSEKIQSIMLTDDQKKWVDHLSNEESEGWINGVRFEKYLKKHSKILEKYRKLKEEGDGLSVKEYYRKKIEFVNGILGKTD